MTPYDRVVQYIEVDSMEPLLTVTDVAEIVRKHPTTIRRWVARGVLVASRPGGQELLFQASDVQGAIDRTRTKASPAVSDSPPRRATRREERQVVPSPSRAPIVSLREEYRRLCQESGDRPVGGVAAQARATTGSRRSSLHP